MQVELFDFVLATVGVQEEIAFVFKQRKKNTIWNILSEEFARVF